MAVVRGGSRLVQVTYFVNSLEELERMDGNETDDNDDAFNTRVCTSTDHNSAVPLRFRSVRGLTFRVLLSSVLSL